MEVEMTKCKNCGAEMEKYINRFYNHTSVFVCVNSRCKSCGMKVFLKMGEPL